MAFQLPNFLAAETKTPDYSGLADIFQNYYAGKEMPKQDLINSIKAEFARPTAEQALLSSKLSNRGAELTNRGSELSNRTAELKIQQYVRELAQQKAFEQQLKQALMGNSGNAGIPSISPDRAQAVAQALSQNQPQNPNIPMGQSNNMPGTPGLTGNAGAAAIPVPSQASTVAPASSAVLSQPSAATAPENEMHEITVSKGEPHLAGIDQMWDSSPLSREFLKKKGYEKKEEVKFDNKTGKTSIITRYPSGRVTVQSVGGISSDNGIPLTKSMITKHQNVIAGVDMVIPKLYKILELGGGEKLDAKGMPAGKNADVFQPYPRSSGYMPGMGYIPGWMSDAANYESLVTSVAEPLVNALGYPKTNEGIEKAVQQVVTSHGERNYRYIKRIRDLIKELEERKKYSENEVKRSNKINPIAGMSNEPEYSSNDYEVSQ